LGIFKSRKVSSADLSLAFGAIAFPIHVWAIINILIIFPAWLLRLSLWELAGAVGYPLLDAFIESAILWIVMAVLALILPGKWLADKFVALSSVLIWLLSAWVALAHFIFASIVQWGPEQMIPALLLVAFSFVLVYGLVQRFARLESWIKKAAQGLAVLTYIYMLFDLLGLVVVVIRNL